MDTIPNFQARMSLTENFDGSSSNYDGVVRTAAINNTRYLLVRLNFKNRCNEK
jgi:hypothetical protein